MANKDEGLTFPRMFEGVEAFVSKFNRIRIKKEGRSIEYKHPVTGKKMSFTALIAGLVADYVRFTDAANSAKKSMESDPSFVPLYQEADTNRFKAATYLSYLIAYGYASSLFDEGLDEKVDELTRENAELKSRVADLTVKLEACEKNYEGLRKILRDSGQVGGVSE